MNALIRAWLIAVIQARSSSFFFNSPLLFRVAFVYPLQEFLVSSQCCNTLISLRKSVVQLYAQLLHFILEIGDLEDREVQEFVSSAHSIRVALALSKNESEMKMTASKTPWIREQINRLQ